MTTLSSIVSFHEEQQFRQLWLWALLVIICLGSIFAGWQSRNDAPDISIEGPLLTPYIISVATSTPAQLDSTENTSEAAANPDNSANPETTTSTPAQIINNGSNVPDFVLSIAVFVVGNGENLVIGLINAFLKYIIPILVLVLILAFLLLFRSIKLVTEIGNDGIYISYFPFLRRRILFDEISTAEARTYSLLEFGGWGVRWMPGRGWAYNVSGNQGVQLVFTNGKRLMIGSQRPEELARAISEGMSRDED